MQQDQYAKDMALEFARDLDWDWDSDYQKPVSLMARDAEAPVEVFDPDTVYDVEMLPETPYDQPTLQGADHLALARYAKLLAVAVAASARSASSAALLAADSATEWRERDYVESELGLSGMGDRFVAPSGYRDLTANLVRRLEADALSRDGIEAGCHLANIAVGYFGAHHLNHGCHAYERPLVDAKLVKWLRAALSRVSSWAEQKTVFAGGVWLGFNPIAMTVFDRALPESALLSGSRRYDALDLAFRLAYEEGAASGTGYAEGNLPPRFNRGRGCSDVEAKMRLRGQLDLIAELPESGEPCALQVLCRRDGPSADQMFQQLLSLVMLNSLPANRYYELTGGKGVVRRCGAVNVKTGFVYAYDPVESFGGSVVASIAAHVNRGGMSTGAELCLSRLGAGAC